MGPEDTWKLDDPGLPSWIDRGPSDSWRDRRKDDSTVDRSLEPSDTWEPNPMIYPYDSHDLPRDHDGTATTSVSEGGTSCSPPPPILQGILIVPDHLSLSTSTLQLANV